MMEQVTTTSLAGLSAAKRLLLEKRLQGTIAPIQREETIPSALPSGPIPASFAQQRLWFFEQLTPGNPMYNIYEALRLQGPLDVRALEQSLAEIVQRHEALRTVFECANGRPVQVIRAGAPFTLQRVDLRSRPEAQREEELQRLLAQEAAQPFDLSRDLMLRVTLYSLSEKEYVLFLVMHHIASDGWSLGVLFHELTALYNAFRQQRPASLPELPIQYADYAVWQRQAVESGNFAAQLAFWKKQLAGAPAVLDLRVDHPRPPVQTFRGVVQNLSLPSELAKQLKEISRQEGATLYMLLLAAFNTLLHRYSRQTDIIVGSPIAGRNQYQTEGLIGFFINTLALRTNLSQDPPFRQLLQRVRRTTLDAFANQDLPFDKLVLELQPERSSSHSPLFQTLFALQNVPAQPLRLEGLSLSRIPIDNGTAKCDLTMIASESGQELQAALEYNVDLFEAGTITRMLGHYKSLLEGIAAQPEQRLSELPLLTQQERSQLLVEWNATEREFPRGQTVHQLFEAQAARSPQAVAVEMGNQRLTYSQLNARANQLARLLQEQGAGPGTCVALCLDRGLDLIVSLLAVLKAGAAYLPLDRSYPKERLAFMLADANAPLLITQQRLVQDWMTASPSGVSPKLICLDAEEQNLQRHSMDNPLSAASGESVAYIIYTSGSTGRPKGTCIPHRAINRLVINTDYVRLEASDVMAQVSNCSFDAATFEIWGALLHGAKLVILDNELLLSPKDFARQLKEQGVTTMFLTTALFNLMARENPSAFRGLRQLLVGGEALDPRWIAEVLRANPPARLLNAYGPTETTTFALCYDIKSVPDGTRSIPIGRPIANTILYILDEHAQPVPVGIPGELYLGGPGVGCGYLNRPELTRERFVPNPFVDEPGARLYKTGDWVRYRPDGNVEFLGRLDSQVKIRGFRVELEEIEIVLGAHPAVRQCAVILREALPGQKSIDAYVVPAREEEGLADKLREYLGAKLPEYMVPAAIVPVPALPLTANGKVDRRALSASQHGRLTIGATADYQSALQPEAGKKYLAPRDALEKELVQIWEEVLARRPIGIAGQFFQLGGHSLLAVELTVRIEKAFGKKLSVSAIFQAPTVEQLASVLRRGESGVAASSLVEIQGRGTHPPLFLVHGVGGGMFWGYQNLSLHLGKEQPVYVLKSRAMDGKEEFRRLEDMAAHYVAELRAFQPRGPYFLGGYCFGGNVAYEMARQLTQQGHAVALLALMNCAPPNSSYAQFRWTPRSTLNFFRNLAFLTRNSSQWSATQRNDFLRWKLRLLHKTIREFLAGNHPSKTELEVERFVDLSTFPEEQRKLWKIHVESLLAYHPAPYAGRITLFRARAHPFLCSFDPLCGWGELAAGGVDLKLVSGPHEGILDEPHVQALARELQLCLKAAQGKETPASPPPELEPGPHGPSWRLPVGLILSLLFGIVLAALCLDESALGFAVSNLFNFSTAATLAATGWVGRPDENRPPTQPIPKAPQADSWPLSPTQQRLWFLAQLDPDDPAYNLPLAIRLQGRLDLPALERSLNEIVRRHSILRTTFSIENHKPRQIVSPQAKVSLPVIDLRLFSRAEQAPQPRGADWSRELQQLLVEEARRIFDLTGDLMLRSVLLRVDDTEAILLNTFHHLAADPWSLGIFIDELEDLYAAYAKGTPSGFSELPVQYHDYTLWQREQLQGARLQEVIQFWKKQLAGAPTLLELPADRPRPPVQSTRGGRQPIQLNAELTQALKPLGAQEEATLSMTLLAGFAAVLVRYSGREDLLIGSPVVNRSQPELEQVIGPFMNTLVLRADAGGDPRFLELLRRTRDRAMAALAHQEAPFEILLEELKPKRDRSFHPLFQAMFALQKPPRPKREAGGITWESLEVDAGASKYDLTLQLTETGSGLAGWFEYASELFSAGRMERMARNFQTLLEGIAAEPARRLSELPLLAQPERLLVLEEWNRTAREAPADRTVTRLFEQQAARQPEAEALVGGEKRLTYGELNRRANQLAQALRALGVGPDVLVSLCLERSPDLVIGILGILKAGGAYVPLDPAYPAHRLSFMLQDAGSPILLTQKKLLDRLPPTPSNIVCLDGEELPAPATSSAVENTQIQPNHLAYILYTSGSTGQPKGVAVEHRSVTALLHWAREIYSPEELAGVLFVTSPCFDISVFEMFVPLAWGGKVVLADNALEWTRQPAAGEVTLLNTVPSVMTEWLRAGGLPASVRTVNMAGEPLTQTLVDQVYERCPRVQKVYDLYGPTEATVYSTFAWRKPGERPTIGRPLSNQQIYLLDRHGQPVPIGVPGELHIGGIGLARGYLNQPELTAQKFIPNPFQPGQRLYKTGDLARYYDNGDLEYLGRLDHQVKIRGLRIELGEIETHLRRHPAVREAVVIAREDDTDKRLVGYYVAAPQSDTEPPDEVSLRNFLKQSLPDFMLPARFVALEALPRTSNGKVDRKALPAPEEAPQLVNINYVPPRTETEELLAGIWREVLLLPQVGVHHNFFELGGHSLMIMQMLSRIREAIDINLPMRAVFDAPTVAALATVIENSLAQEIAQLSEEEAQQLASRSTAAA